MAQVSVSKCEFFTSLLLGSLRGGGCFLRGTYRFTTDPTRTPFADALKAHRNHRFIRSIFIL